MSDDYPRENRGACLVEESLSSGGRNAWGGVGRQTNKLGSLVRGHRLPRVHEQTLFLPSLSYVFFPRWREVMLGVVSSPTQTSVYRGMPGFGSEQKSYDRGDIFCQGQPNSAQNEHAFWTQELFRGIRPFGWRFVWGLEGADTSPFNDGKLYQLDAERSLALFQSRPSHWLFPTRTSRNKVGPCKNFAANEKKSNQQAEKVSRLSSQHGLYDPLNKVQTTISDPNTGSPCF